LKNLFNPTEVKRLILREFHFLEEEYDFKIVDKTKRPYVSITYRNPTTAVRVGYEPRDRGVFVLLICLVDGEIPPYPIHIQPGDKINMFYLDDLMTLRASDSEASDFEASAVSSNPKSSIARAASALRTYATDILTGDFDVFVELDQIVKRR